LRDDLRPNIINVWINETNLGPGTQAWQDTTQQEREHTGCVVVLISPMSKQSHWVKRGLTYAENWRIRIFPVLFIDGERNTIPPSLVNTKRIDARQNYDDEFRKLLAAIENQLKLVGTKWPAPQKLIQLFC
jgi:hypothetical protein